MHRPLAFLMLAVLVSSPASAQTAPAGGASGLDTLDCREMARSGAPMTVEACEARVAAMRNLQQSMMAPGGERPGDDALSCDQIAAEMKQASVTPLPREHVAEGLAAGRQVQDVQQRLAAEAAATSASQAARTAAASAGPNAAQGAVAATNMAEQQALRARAAAQMGPARSRLDAANVVTQNDLAAMMRSNPRFARLAQLAMQRNCTFTDK